MNGEEGLLLFVAGFAAGAINAAVGSGSLLTFSALLAMGVPPVLANGTSCVGLVPGAVGATHAFRDVLDRRVIRWGVLVAVCAILGALTVLVLPSAVFAAVVPWLILMAVGLVALQPLMVRHLPQPGTASSTLALSASGFYGGYFGAGQGITFLAALSASGVRAIHQATGFKNALAGIASFCAAVMFMLAGQVMWLAAAVMAVSSLLGGWVGGRLTRRLPPAGLRALVVAVGLVAAFLAFRGG